MRAKLSTTFALLVPIVLTSFGCRAHPGSLAMMVVGDLINDADVKERQETLRGKTALAADEMFGSRQETLEDTRRSERVMIVYPVKGDLLGTSRYVVEAKGGRIVALSKTIQNIDGVADVIRSTGLRAKLIGKLAVACEREGDFGRPVVVLRDRETGELVRVYDVRNFTNLRGARYCVLRFDANNRCAKVTLVGVSASTKKEPAGG